MSRILITGGTGQLGSAVVNELIEKKVSGEIVLMVRDLTKAASFKEKGIKLIKGDYNDYKSLVSAFREVDKLYFISGSDIANRGAQHENVVKAARESKPGHIIYTSFQRKTDDNTSPIAFVASSHILAEKLIKESGLTYTIMKHALYADILPGFLGDQFLSTGKIFLPAGNGKTSFTSRNDMASAGVAVLTGKGHENKTYEISVNTSYSFHDIASILTTLSGKEIQYTSPDVETFVKVLEKAGVPKDGILGMSVFCQAIAQGEFDFPSKTLELLIRRKPENLKDFLKKAYKF